jgi:hypothetical protein
VSLLRQVLGGHLFDADPGTAGYTEGVMRGLAWRRVLLFAATATLATGAQAQGFFGPVESTAVEAEVDAYYHVTKGVRLQAQVQPYFVPASQLSQTTFALYASWMVAEVLQDLISPDKTKSHLADFRVGVLYTATFDAGNTGSGDNVTLQMDFTPRYSLPLDVLASFRNRVSFSWGIGRDAGYTFTYRARPQLEREFDLGGASLIPYMNVEVFWQHPPEMWTQFRLQGGIQCGFQAFAKGQVVEVNFSAITNLQPSRSWTPQVELILSSYF